jgi:hypothetical protein
VVAPVAQGAAVALQAVVAVQVAVALPVVVAGVPDQQGRSLPLCLLLDVALTRRDWTNLTATFNYRSCGHDGTGGTTSVN